MKFKDVLQKLGIENRYNTFFPEYYGYLRNKWDTGIIIGRMRSLYNETADPVV
jgi:hypothetical protein